MNDRPKGGLRASKPSWDSVPLLQQQAASGSSSAIAGGSANPTMNVAVALVAITDTCSVCNCGPLSPGFLVQHGYYTCRHFCISFLKMCRLCQPQGICIIFNHGCIALQNGHSIQTAAFSQVTEKHPVPQGQDAVDKILFYC